MTINLANTLLIRRKHFGKRGIPKAVMYRKNVFDPSSDLEAAIEAYGAENVKRFIDAIERKRQNELAEHPDNFRAWPL